MGALRPIDFLRCATPQAWIEAALVAPELLLIDHAHCEKKAASTALNLMFRYVDRPALLDKLSRLAREELRHFEQVLKIMRRRGIAYRHLTPSRYAGALRERVRSHEPGRLTDLLIVGAFIEARSCERFEALAPYLDEELAAFYRGLCASESRHFSDYLALAREAGNDDVGERAGMFAELEAELVTRADSEFRFHSGPPAH